MGVAAKAKNYTILLKANSKITTLNMLVKI